MHYSDLFGKHTYRKLCTARQIIRMLYLILSGYVYLIFDCERSVKNLLMECTQEYSGGFIDYYFKVSSKRMRSKEVIFN